MIPIKRRSNSIDDQLSLTVRSFSEDTFFAEELNENLSFSKQWNLAHRKKRDGYIHIKGKSWLSLCCAASSENWYKKFLLLTQDKLVICKSSSEHDGTVWLLKQLEVEISSTLGHNGKFYCLRLLSSNGELEISFGCKDDFEYWYTTIRESIDAVDVSGYFYTKGVLINNK